MDWIKRNLLFVIGSVVALVLMGLAGFYLWTGLAKNDEALTKLSESYAKLGELNGQKPHPGDDRINNIAAATNQMASVRGFISKTTKVLQQVPAIPASTNVDSGALAAAMRQTVDQMRKDASSRGVQIVTNYHFSFTAVKDRIMFDRAGIAPLATQLGEVKAICDVLFTARVNTIDSIRREKVSVHDTEAQLTTDYLDHTTITNEIALLSPYEVSFRGFSPEIAAVLAGFANAPYGFVVRAVNVEQSGGAGAAALATGYGEMAPVANPYNPNPYANRYGLTGGRRGFAEEGGFTPPAPVAPAPGTAPVGKGGLQTLLDEKQLKVTMLVEVVKPVVATSTAR